MGQFHNMMMMILVTVAVAATILKPTEAAEYTVGGSTTGWISAPSGGASFYSDWASTITFREGDILVFRFTGGHTVAELNGKASFDSCSVDQNQEVLSTSPARITLNRTGEFYFACTVQGHCSSGQKLSVNVTGSSTSPSPPGSGATTPSPQSPPTVPGSTTPPPSPGSATSLVATFSLLFISLVINSLF